MDEINFYSKSKEHGWLSNFYKSPIVTGGHVYPTNEHFYQSQKAADEAHARWIREAPTAFAAKRAGRILRAEKGEFRADWDEVKVSVMLKGLRLKFTQNPELRMQLLATGDALLHEDSDSDMFWGKKGEDMLGKLLVKVRDEIRRGEL